MGMGGYWVGTGYGYPVQDSGTKYEELALTFDFLLWKLGSSELGNMDFYTFCMDTTMVDKNRT